MAHVEGGWNCSAAELPPHTANVRRPLLLEGEGPGLLYYDVSISRLGGAVAGCSCAGVEAAWAADGPGPASPCVLHGRGQRQLTTFHALAASSRDPQFTSCTSRFPPTEQPSEQDHHHRRGRQPHAAQHLGRRLPTGAVQAGAVWHDGLLPGSCTTAGRWAGYAHLSLTAFHLALPMPPGLQKTMPGFCFSVNAHRAFSSLYGGWPGCCLLAGHAYAHGTWAGCSV